MKSIDRRRLLRGVLQGSAVAVALPFLECFLNGNGTALASGAPLPVRFGTWFWGCGNNLKRFVPTKVGADYDILPELRFIEPYKKNVTVLSGFNALLDGATNFCHHTGQYSILTGVPPKTKEQADAPTFDTAIAAKIGSGTRFRSIEMSVTGDPRDSYSRPSPTVINPGEVSPVALYQRIFGPEFVDPNQAEFKPDPNIMLRQSVLSAVQEQHASFIKTLGQADRIRLDQYLTSLRQTEQQLALQLEKPPPAEACERPSKPNEATPGSDVDTAAKNHKLFAKLITMALACNQTRVFNMVFSNSFSTLRKPGTTTAHHQVTHEELIDEKLGYQPTAAYFVEQSLQAWGEFLNAITSIPEGDGTLLDNCLVFALSDTQFAKVHSIAGIPMMIAGKAGGKLRPGLHVVGNGDPVTRVSLTVQQAMGLSIDSFGTKSMQTSKPVTEILA